MLAWPTESRLHFDASYEPVAMGKTLFLGSPNDGSVTAFDTETGDVKWRFYTNGPVRFAPVAWKDKLYAGSDDCHLYCLDAATGKVKWIFRAAPEDRPDLHHLGNNRLISFWPVRGGPALAGSTVYIASGVWPTLGVFVYAVNAETGQVIWKNEKLNYLKKIKIDHNMVSDDTGLAPQGYLAVAGDILLIPNGRSMPAGLDLKTGEFRYYVQGYRSGHNRVTAMGKYAFVGPAAVLQTQTGCELGGCYARNNPQRAKDRYVGESPYHPYKIVNGCDAWSVLCPNLVYGVHSGAFYAYDLKQPKISTYKRNSSNPYKWEPRQLWKQQSKYTASSRAIIKAGGRLYGHSGNRLMAMDIPKPGKSPKISWIKTIPDTPKSMLAADNKLFIATEKGTIYCFGAKAGKAKTHKLARKKITKIEDTWTKKAADILKLAKIADGYAVILGLDSGRLVEELVAQSALKIIGVDADREKVNALRDKMVAARLYGNRVELFVGDPLEYNLPPFIASLVVSETLSAPKISAKIKADELFTIIRPYGGAACFDSTADPASFQTWISNGDLKSAQVVYEDGFALLRRAGPLPGSASWTHESADAGRSYFSKDKRIKGPLGILWYGDGEDHGALAWHNYGAGVKPQVVGGRLFALYINKRIFKALDVYTGRLLWEKTVPAYTRYASMPEAIFIASGNTCTFRDPSTGRALKKIKYDPGFSGPVVSDIRVGEDVVIIALGKFDRGKRERATLEGLWDGKFLVALDRTSGKQLWRKGAKERFNLHALAIGEGLVYCIDSVAQNRSSELTRRGNPPKDFKSTIIAVEARTGKTKWSFVATHTFEKYTSGAFLQRRGLDDWLAYSKKCKILLAGKNFHVCAFDAQTGKPLWDKVIKGAQPMILRGDTFVHQQGQEFDIRTGKQVSDKTFYELAWGGQRGCNYGVGNENFYFLRDITSTYIDAKTGQRHRLRSLRAGCDNAYVPADGVLTVPNFSYGCVCNYPVQSSFAMVHMPVVKGWDGAVALPGPGTQRNK